MKQPLFSIITVTLNPGEDLTSTIDSVLGQSFEGYEILIKDGGSTDGTENLTWDDPRIKRHTSPDTGIFDAMNQALALATGDYICFLNAGDTFETKNSLSVVADAASADHEVEFIYGNIFHCKSKEGIKIYPQKLSRRFLFMNTICHQAWFVKRKVYQRYHGFETLHAIGADYRILLKMIVRDKISNEHLPEVLVRYQGGGYSANTSRRSASAPWRDELRREIYGQTEYSCYKLIFAARRFLKTVFYNRLGWRIWRKYRHRASAFPTSAR